MRIANETAEALSNIVDSVNKAVHLGNEIAAASNEQAIGIAEIQQGIAQLSQVVQNNSVTAQEGAMAGEELFGQSELLREKVRQFRLKDNRHKNIHMNTEQHDRMRTPLRLIAATEAKG